MATNDAGVSLANRAFHTTRERILDGTYAPGSRLRLHSIAEESGASSRLERCYAFSSGAARRDYP